MCYYATPWDFPFPLSHPSALIPQHIISCLFKGTPPTRPLRQCRLHPQQCGNYLVLFPLFKKKKNITYTRPSVSVKKCGISKMITPHRAPPPQQTLAGGIVRQRWEFCSYSTESLTTARLLIKAEGGKVMLKLDEM